MKGFARVVERENRWHLELPGSPPGGSFATLAAALDAARAAGPDWIEVGRLVPAAAGAPQHHSWSTLRRAAGDRYLPSALAWAPPPEG